MWFRNLQVKSFAGIKEANLDLEPGLNVLFGPNELGKSTLVQAMRAALLLPHNSSAHRQFVDWHEDRSPEVCVTFETEEQRVWRVSKRFGAGATGSSLLEFSRDGVSFSLEAKAREVDGRLREILSWGAGSPGGSRGRSKGWPDTFLSTALLGSQDEVELILDKGLDDDLDESGKDLLLQSLQAIAESPIFRRVIESAQEKVDEAFTATGKRKRSKGSPWMESQQRIRLRREHLEQLRRQGEESSSAKSGTASLQDDVLQAEGQLREGQALLARDEGAWRQKLARTVATQAVQDAKAERDQIQGLHRVVAETEERIAAANQSLTSADKDKRKAETRLASAQADQRQATQRVQDLESDDAEQKRKIRRQEIEKEILQVKSSQSSAQREFEFAQDALEKGEKASAAQESVGKLETQLEEASALLEPARSRIEGEQQELAGARLAELYEKFEASTQASQSATKRAEEAQELRRQATDLRDESDTLQAEVSDLDLPSEEQLRELGGLESALQVAEAKLQIDLTLRISPSRQIEVRVDQADGSSKTHTIESPETFEAEGTIHASIEGVADLEVTAGNAEHRQEATIARETWEVATGAFFARLELDNLQALEQLCRDALQKVAKATRLNAEAEALEAKAEGLGQSEAGLSDLASSASQARQAVVGALPEGMSFAELSARVEAGELELADQQALEQRISTLRGRTRELETGIATDRGKLETLRMELEALKREADEAKGKLSAEPQRERDRAQTQLEARAHRLEELTEELCSLDGHSASEVTEARKAIETSRRVVTMAEAELTTKGAAREEAKKIVDRLKGELSTRKASAEAEDLAGAKARVEEKQAALDSIPLPKLEVDEERLEAARSSVEGMESRLNTLRLELTKKEGALEQVGGEYIEEKTKEAEEALISATKEEQDLELEYASWQLLLDTLKEAETEDAVHLGNSLVVPVSENMKKLTRGRYNSVSLGPKLSGAAVELDGVERALDLLSIGTRDQLATLIRLAVAQAVKTALVLDDQLVHSDPHRMEWLSELMYACADEFQILVFTCRPEEYELENQTARTNWIDLEQAIQRTKELIPASP